MNGISTTVALLLSARRHILDPTPRFTFDLPAGANKTHRQTPSAGAEAGGGIWLASRLCEMLKCTSHELAPYIAAALLVHSGQADRVSASAAASEVLLRVYPDDLRLGGSSISTLD